jgi:hypothetical protein
MARFVVVEIQDNDEADEFIEAIKRGDVFFGYKKGPDAEHILSSDDTYAYKSGEGWKVPQVYAVPSLFCECSTTYKEGRSSKYGWWVCTKCSRPRKGSMQHPFNLLERNVDPLHRVYYMGFRADRRGWRIPKEG